MTRPAMTATPAAFRDALSTDTEVLVTDLDGVLRLFDPRLWDTLDARLGLAPGTTRGCVLGHPVLPDVVVGRVSHARWREQAAAALAAHGVDPDAARRAVEDWSRTPGRVDLSVLAALEEAEAAGVPTFVLTNGTDRVREEMAALDPPLLRWAGTDRLLNSAELGAAKPEPEVFARARTRIEEALGQGVDPGGISFVDDTARHVEAARAAGWQARLHP